MVDTHRNPSPKENGLNTQKQGHRFEKKKKKKSSSSTVYQVKKSFSPIDIQKQLTLRERRFCGLFGASYISWKSESPGSWSATEKQQNDFGFGIVRFIFYLKLARLQ